ncbi:hypothetical protein HRR83_003806 [Exophiala dermatitidis]|uniref:Uncharacterized protein n=2 Tax=Exophiala dermatitidis TaxID=5970 RepID=H6BPJ4_EXODN|nr:uncharacterized protein HMPREF1120_01785 [Exophiala dermatitidis NIH/UT8656]KAJ4518897.1 hypothetical protein HRR75_002572 [Exophiala dermatitidis]EHY53596.1 hypothetical protein HMPREF1120_01785 [Exophiala dermatitidis NIH/UT8656]KAJ4522230.1 hypothetical protein HRR74_002812 [Exophiala dermatitidis]KAJ4529556.1 hypothetical protein HRR73_000581 [Exophiala dermatitidis]KAJ4543285.1 hypothetical protein HRR77_005539 [Exophiala dermatitidis]
MGTSGPFLGILMLCIICAIFLGLFWSRDYIRHIRWQRQQAARQRREEEGQLTPSDASLTELSIVSSASSSPVYEPEPIYPPPQPAPRPAAAGYARQPVPPSALNADSSATVASSSRLRATTTVYHYFGDTRSALAGPSSTATIISEGSSASKSLPPPYASSEEVELPVYGTSRSFSRNAAVEAQNAFAAEDTDTSSRTGFEERRSSTPPTPRPRAPTPASEARMTTPMPSAAAPATPAMARRQRTFVLDPPATPIIRPQRARVAPHQRLRRERQALALERRYPILRTFQ